MCSKQAQTTSPEVYTNNVFPDLSAKTAEVDWYENDLHLAAELGKTLLDQNRELQEALRQDQIIIDDQNLEIEYLTKQTVALREVNESRVKIYEQLELTNQELETSNARLRNEISAQNKKLTSQCNNVQLLEARCDELQQMVEDLRHNQKSPTPKPEPTRRHTVSNLSDLVSKAKITSPLPSFLSSSKTEDDVDQLLLTLKDVQAQRLHEQRRREALEEEVAALVQEIQELQAELGPLQSQVAKVKTLESELLAIQEASNFEKWCKKCSCSIEEDRGDKPSFESDVEEEQPSVSSGVLVKLNNGGHAYGSEESLWSEGHDLDSTGSPAPSSKPPSLMSELDAHYRNIIGQLMKSQSPVSMNDVLTDYGSSLDGSMKEYTSPDGCKALKSKISHPLEANRCSLACDDNCQSQGVQTEAYTPLHHRLHMPPHQDPLQGYFCKTPEYKTIFQEIFLVLKQSVGSKSTVRQKPTSKEKKCEMIPMTMLCADSTL